MGEGAAFRLKFQLLFRLSLVFMKTTVSSKVKLQASTVNIFGRLNSQFNLPQNFISQNDRGSLTLSIEYHL